MRSARAVVNKSQADTVVVGSGIAGVLVARELVRKGQRCTIVERGSLVPWEEQMRTLRYEADVATAKHNTQSDFGLEYVYGVGGSTNHWTGTTPRFLPEDFKMRSNYGVMVDWPIDYEQLAPYYALAEDAMGVAGAPNELMPGAEFPLPAHPLSPQDEALKPFLEPVIPLPQARPTRPVGSRPACCGSARCDLCPVNARYSVLNGLNQTLESSSVELIEETIAVRLTKTSSGNRIAALECVDAEGATRRIEAKRFVIAANAIESPALLLRSDIKTPDTGRYFSTRQSTVLELQLREPVGPGRGSSRNTAGCYAYYRGSFRDRRAAVLLAPVNFGASDAMVKPIKAGLLEGKSGKALRRHAVAKWQRAMAIDATVEDAPNPANTVTLSSTKDSFGIPLNRVQVNPPGPYERAALAHIEDDIGKRLRRLGVLDANWVLENRGAHLLGTLRMGNGAKGVVDSDLRHVGIDNLFVAGGAVFPTYSGTHPTLTIAALAIRLGRNLSRSG